MSVKDNRTQIARHPPNSSDGSGEHEERRDKNQEREEEEIHQKSAAGAHIVYKAILKEAEEELARPSIALAWSGLAAGLSMGFSLIMEGLLESHLPDVPWRPLVEKIGYTFGFVIVILGRQQLFTENTLTPVLSLLKNRDVDTLRNLTRLWIIILLTNILGAGVIAYTLQRTPAFSQQERDAFLTVSMHALEPSVGVLFIRSIFAGWLIALMVWMLPVAETGRIWVTMLIPYVVGLGSLSHIIIGSVYCIYTIAAHEHTWMQYLVHFALPVLTGNIIGGVTLVAVVNYGQVMGGSEE